MSVYSDRISTKERHERLLRLGAIPVAASNPHQYGPPVPWGYKTMAFVTSRDILKVVSIVWRKSEADITADRRDLECLLPRVAVIHLARKLTRASSSQIGRAVRRDHSTVLNTTRSALRRIALDDAFARKVAITEDIIRKKFCIPTDGGQ